MGEVETGFAIGDGVANLLGSNDFLVASYFDEGVFGGDTFGREGVAIFRGDGQFVAGYRASGAGVEVWDCYCICWSGFNEVIFSPYGEPNFPLVWMNIQEMTFQMWSTPPELHGSSALTSLSNTIIFYSPYDLQDRPTGRGDKFISWNIGSEEFDVAGELPQTHRIRGLPGGRFILPNPDGYAIISFGP